MTESGFGVNSRSSLDQEWKNLFKFVQKRNQEMSTKNSIQPIDKSILEEAFSSISRQLSQSQQPLENAEIVDNEESFEGLMRTNYNKAINKVNIYWSVSILVITGIQDVPGQSLEDRVTRLEGQIAQLRLGSAIQKIGRLSRYRTLWRFKGNANFRARISVGKWEAE